MKRGVLWVLLLSLAGLGGVWSVHAATFNSSNFSINGNLGDSAAGGQSSTNYQLISAGGESIAGDSASASYKLAQGYIPQLGLSANSLQLVVQPNGLAGYWPLENSATGATAFDESTNSNDGTYSVNPESVAGKVGQAWSDTTIAQYIDVPSSASLSLGNKMTISGWIYNDNFSARAGGTQSAIITKWPYTPNDGSWAFQTTPGGTNLRMFVKASGVDDGLNYVDTTNAAMIENTWYHATVVYDGALTNTERVKFFLNGSPLTTTTAGTIPTTLTPTTERVTIGDFPGLNRYWPGALDEIKLYNRALTQMEIAADYSASNVGIPAGLAFANAITPGQSQTSLFDAIVRTDAPGYNLSINQNNNLTSGGGTIGAVSGSIGSPVSWTESVTKGLGFTLYGTNATAIPGTWASGGAYAAIPGSSTTFYTRTGTPSTKDVLNMRLRLDIQASQAIGNYANQAILTGTMTP